jgi:NCS1 family nucleobase:cation symporter-1
MVDYFVIKRGNIHTLSLFDPTPGSLYYYTKGWNLKAFACWVSAAVFGVPGLIGAYHPTWVAAAGIHIYQTGWVICFAVAVSFYFVLNYLLPARVFPAGHDSPKTFEGLAETEGYFDGEPLVMFGVTHSTQHTTSSTTSVVSTQDVVGGEKV